MKKYQQITLREFKGLNTVDDPSVIEDNELQECDNFDITDAGTLRKRSGAQRVGNDYITGAFAGSLRLLGRQRTATVDKIYVTNGAKLWRMNTLDYGAVEEITYLGVSIPDVSWGFQSRDNFQVVCLSSMNYGVAPGSAAAIAGNGPEGTFALAYKTRMWTVNTLDTTGLEYRLYFSALGVYNSWTTATDFLDVGYGDGTPIVAMAVLADTLYIFKSESVWSLQADGSPSNWVLRQVNPTVGCVGRGTVQVIDGMIYFLSRTGVYRTDGTTFEEVSGKIRNKFVNRPFSSREQLLEPDAGYYDSKYLVFPRVPDTVVNGQTVPSVSTGYVYHINRDAWTTYSMYIPVTLFAANSGGGPEGFVTVSEYETEFLYFGHSSFPLIFRFRADGTHHTDFGREYERAEYPVGNGFDLGESDPAYTAAEMNTLFSPTGGASFRTDVSNSYNRQTNGYKMLATAAGGNPSSTLTYPYGPVVYFGANTQEQDLTFHYSYDGTTVPAGVELVVELRDSLYGTTGNYIRFGIFYTGGNVRVGVEQMDGGVSYTQYFGYDRQASNSEWLRLAWQGPATMTLQHGGNEGEYDAPLVISHYPSWTVTSSTFIYAKRTAGTTTNFYVHRLGSRKTYYGRHLFPCRYTTKQFDFNSPTEYKDHKYSMIDKSPDAEIGLPYEQLSITTTGDYNYRTNEESFNTTNHTVNGIHYRTRPITSFYRTVKYAPAYGATRTLRDGVYLYSNTPEEIFAHVIAYSKRGGVNEYGN